MDQSGADAHRHPFDLDLVAFGIDPAAEFGDRAVDCDQSVGDQLFAGPSTTDADPGQNLLEPFTGMLRSGGCPRAGLIRWF